LSDDYYEVDVNHDGRLDAVVITETDDGTPIAVADVNGDGYADYALSIDELVEDMELDSSVRQANVWTDQPTTLDPEDYQTEPTY
jgi:hypothetical protein